MSVAPGSQEAGRWKAEDTCEDTTGHRVDITKEAPTRSEADAAVAEAEAVRDLLRAGDAPLTGPAAC